MEDFELIDDYLEACFVTLIQMDKEYLTRSNIIDFLFIEHDLKDIIELNDKEFEYLREEQLFILNTLKID